MTVGCRRVGVTSSASLQQLQGTCLAGADVGRIVMATHFTQPRTTCAVYAPELRTTSCRGSVATPSDERLRRRRPRPYSGQHRRCSVEWQPFNKICGPGGKEGRDHAALVGFWRLATSLPLLVGAHPDLLAATLRVGSRTNSRLTSLRGKPSCSQSSNLPLAVITVEVLIRSTVPPAMASGGRQIGRSAQSADTGAHALSVIEVGVESPPPTPQRQHQSQEQRRFIEGQGQRDNEYRCARQDAAPAHDVAPARVLLRLMTSGLR